MKKYFLLILISGCISTVSGQSSTDTPPPRPPNIVFMFIDDMGYADLSSYGNHLLATPNMDWLAREGIKLTNFYVASPICSPSRVAVTTGQYPARHRIHSYLARREKNDQRSMVHFLNPEVPTLARTMQQAGYATAHFGKWHMGGGRDVEDAPLPQAYGFDESLVSFEGLGDRLLIKGDGLSKASAKLKRGQITWVEKHEMTPIYVDRAINFIQEHRSEPFYLHLWPNDVHDPHRPDSAQRQRFDQFANNHYQQDFFAVLHQLDQQIGRLLNTLDSLQLTDNTLVVLTSDNGPTDWPRYYEAYYWPPGSSDPFRGRKWSLYEGGIREPLLARWPGHIPAGSVDDSTVMHATDLFPTFCALAGVTLPEVDFDGEDMSSVLLGEPHPRKRPLYWEYGRADFYLKPANPRFISPNLAMRHGKWKLLMNADSTQVELYNLANDQAETTNVADDQVELASRMIGKLLQWRKSLDVTTTH